MSDQDTIDSPRIIDSMALWGVELSREQTDAIIKNAFEAFRDLRECRMNMLVQQVMVSIKCTRTIDQAERQILDRESKDLERIIDKTGARLEAAGFRA